MLNKRNHFIFWLLFALLAGFQLTVMTQFELFGDEAFYWLEGQHLAWSYAELPGFTAWLLAFSEWLLPHQPVFLRLLPWIAALSLAFLARAINQLIFPKSQSTHAALLLWSLPLFGMTSVLALPDVWLLFFAVLSVYLLLSAAKKYDLLWFVALGICLALGINVHLRFWLFAGLLGLSALWYFYHRKHLLSLLLTVSLPIALLGFLPVLWFNWQHDFVLLAFQLNERHPWSFQLDHLYFIPVQLLICTPLVLAFWFDLIPKSKQQWNLLSTEHKLVMTVAVCHWLLYFFLGFFSDSLRLNLHWPLLSYVLLFFCFHQKNKSWLSNWAIKTGILAHVLLLITLIFWSQQSTLSKTNHAITKHAQGWSKLAKETQQLMAKHGKTKVIADHFMTTAQLAYQFNDSTIFKTLEHPLSTKHGRALQLQIMGFQMADKSNLSDSLLVIEQTALKLGDQPRFYQNLCRNLGGLKLLSSLNSRNGNKIYHFFEQDKNQCDMPTLFYSATNLNEVSGWVMTRKEDLTSLSIMINDDTEKLLFDTQSIQGSDIFSTLDANEYILNTYKTTPNSCSDCSYQIRAQIKGRLPEYSSRFYP